MTDNMPPIPRPDLFAEDFVLTLHEYARAYAKQENAELRAEVVLLLDMNKKLAAICKVDKLLSGEFEQITERLVASNTRT